MKSRTTCASCGGPITQNPGPGRERLYCEQRCAQTGWRRRMGTGPRIFVNARRQAKALRNAWYGQTS